MKRPSPAKPEFFTFARDPLGEAWGGGPVRKRKTLPHNVMQRG